MDMYTCVMRVCEPMYICSEARGACWVSTSIALYPFPFKGLSLNLEIIIFLAGGQQDQGIFMSPHLSAGIIGIGNHAWLFPWVLGSELGSSCLYNKHSYIVSLLCSLH